LTGSCASRQGALALRIAAFKKNLTLLARPPPARSEKLDKQLTDQQALVATRRSEAVRAQQEAQAAAAASTASGGSDE